MGVFSGVQQVEKPVPVQAYRSSSTSPERSLVQGDEEGESYPHFILLSLFILLSSKLKTPVTLSSIYDFLERTSLKKQFTQKYKFCHHLLFYSNVEHKRRYFEECSHRFFPYHKSPISIYLLPCEKEKCA